MKEYGYRSFGNYVSSMKQLHIKAGFQWSALHELEAKQGARSVTRGQGPPRQSAPLDVDAFAKLDLGMVPLAAGGPVNPGGMALLGSAFLLREIEVAYARLSHLRVDPKARRAHLHLPVSKTDVMAVGCTRVWGCTCLEAEPSADCAYHVAHKHLQLVHARLGITVGDPLCETLPLFPSCDGETVTKAAVVATIEQIAVRCGEALVDASGNRRFGGHSLRVSGAQWLGRLGFEVELVKTFGRWSSNSVMRYLGEAHVSDLARAKMRLVKDRNILQCQAMDLVAANGPQLSTAAEVERIVAAAVSTVSAQCSALSDRLLDFQRASGMRYDLVLSEARKSVHAVAGDLATASQSWRTRCGWRFTEGPGFRLSSSVSLGAPASWARCVRCFPPQPPGLRA